MKLFFHLAALLLLATVACGGPETGDEESSTDEVTRSRVTELVRISQSVNAGSFAIEQTPVQLDCHVSSHNWLICITDFTTCAGAGGNWVWHGEGRCCLKVS